MHFFDDVLWEQVVIGASIDLDMVTMEDLLSRCSVTTEVAFRSLRNTFTTPCDQDLFEESSVWIFYFHETILDLPF